LVIRDELYEIGIEQRRKMFGTPGADAVVDHTTGVNDKIEDFVTRLTFGDVWQRPGLSIKDRSKVTFAMLVATGKPHELRVHARGAIANGVTPIELREIVLQALLYCGIPAAVEGIRGLNDVFRDLGIPPILDGEAEETRRYRPTGPASDSRR
jgi:4-carboxymuconolactone decarboxylase